MGAWPRPGVRRGGVLLCLAGLTASCGLTTADSPRSGTPAAVAAAPESGAPSPSPAPEATPTPTAALCSNLQVISSWSLSRRAAQLVVVPVDETAVDAAAGSVAAGAGGVILFGDMAPPTLGESLRSLQGLAPAGIRPLVMADEEGGGIQRMANLVGSLPWPATDAATMSPGALRSLVAQVARQMAAAGVTMDLAPVLDLASGPGPDPQHTDGPRSFGLDPNSAADYGMAFAQGLEDGGVIPVVKHFPGEGATSANTDYGPASTPPLSELEGNDLLPFEAAIRAGLPAVMVGDASVPGLTAMPASLSGTVISGLLRDRLGFQGLVLTDSLSAKAIADLGISVPQAAVEAVVAGADMVLFNSDTPNTTFEQVVQALVAAVSTGRISPGTLDSAVEQVLAVKGVNLCSAGS